MSTTAAALVTLSSALHVYIWYLESFAWTTKARAVFGTTEAEADATREMAFNQGFYNLFLAVVTMVGLVVSMPNWSAGLALMLAGTGSMLAAALLLFATSPDKGGAAVKQGLFPLLAVTCLVLVAMSR